MQLYIKMTVVWGVIGRKWVWSLEGRSVIGLMMCLDFSQ